MEPLRDELGKIRSETNAIKEKGVGLCSSVKELDNLVCSFFFFIIHYRDPLFSHCILIFRTSDSQMRTLANLIVVSLNFTSSSSSLIMPYSLDFVLYLVRKQLKSLEYRMSHESMSLDEEKRLMKEMKQLEGTRARVIANEASRAKLGHDTEKDALQDKVKVCLSSSAAPSMCIVTTNFAYSPCQIKCAMHAPTEHQK